MGRRVVSSRGSRLRTMPEQTHRHGEVGGSPECRICPVCVLLQALTTSRPDVTRHLVAAGRELTMALTAILDDHAEGTEDADEGLRRINID